MPLVATWRGRLTGRKRELVMAAVGRPRQFDPERALDAALVVFWQHGYEGTSLTDLTTAMGINRPALYSAFGSKKELFFRALQRYYAVDAVYTFQALEAPTAQEATRQYLLRSVEQFTDPERPMGCFVLQGAFVCGPDNRDVADHMVGLRVAAERALRERYERAQADGELPPDEDAASLARYISVVRNGLAVLACDGVPRSELEDSAHRALDGLALRMAARSA
jgi:AcrR family transcriptional regulator